MYGSWTKMSPAPPVDGPPPWPDPPMARPPLQTPTVDSMTSGGQGGQGRIDE